MTANCTLCVPFYGMLLGLLLFSAAVYIAPTSLRAILLLYPINCIMDKTPTNGVSWLSYEQVEKLRSNWLYRWTAQYFPASLHKTVDLNPSEGPYIFLYHPHGVISMGANCALNTNACNFDKTFPGIRRWGVTLNACFYAPLFRDWMLLLGIISANKKTLVTKLSKEKESIVLVPGGAAEALHAHKDNFRLHIRQRKGFIRLALETGAKPIPCLGFGENSSFDTADCGADSILSSFLVRIQKLLSFSTPIILQPIPRRRSIDVLVGKPVRFPKRAENMSESDYVDICHSLYLKELKKLYDNNKEVYGSESVSIEFL